MAEGTRHDTTAPNTTDAAADHYEQALPTELKGTYRNTSDGVDMGKEIRVLRVLLTSLLPSIHLPATRTLIVRALTTLVSLIVAQIRGLGKHSDNEEVLQLFADRALTKQESEKDH